ncbi:PAQR family membrane homeostasis protein TrhA [Singulisphaera sp. PoT]|uniref:PAQR family membrane homeostasis protein TrhA n=1 Tax=Singulisphaera sp. PoT TaxID=3411797 RepID=UPI003BF60E53
MNLLNLREPVSALTHGAWFLMIVPAAVLLCRRVAGNPARWASMVVYTACLAFCALASTLYHAVVVTRDQIPYYLLLDHVGIFLLIAGTFTPIAAAMLHGPWRRWSLVVTWVVAALGICLRLFMMTLPNWLTTSIYLAMGWGSLICYLELTRHYSQWTLCPIPIGGLIYSIGAVFHVFHWPVIWPGYVGAHDLFHVLVMAASAVHFAFILRVVANLESVPDLAVPATPAEAPATRPLVAAEGNAFVIEVPRRSGVERPHVHFPNMLRSRRRPGQAG